MLSYIKVYKIYNAWLLSTYATEAAVPVRVQTRSGFPPSENRKIYYGNFHTKATQAYQNQNSNAKSVKE